MPVRTAGQGGHSQGRLQVLSSAAAHFGGTAEDQYVWGGVSVSLPQSQTQGLAGRMLFVIYPRRNPQE